MMGQQKEPGLQWPRTFGVPVTATKAAQAQAIPCADETVATADVHVNDFLAVQILETGGQLMAHLQPLALDRWQTGWSRISRPLDPEFLRSKSNNSTLSHLMEGNAIVAASR